MNGLIRIKRCSTVHLDSINCPRLKHFNNFTTPEKVNIKIIICIIFITLYIWWLKSLNLSTRRSIIPQHNLSTPFLPVDLAHDLIFSRGLYVYTNAPVSGYFFSEHMFHREVFSHPGTYPVAGTDDPAFFFSRMAAIFSRRYFSQHRPLKKSAIYLACNLTHRPAMLYSHTQIEFTLISHLSLGKDMQVRRPWQFSQHR